MKNNQLHEFINALQPDTTDLPQFQQRLRRTVLNQPRHRSRIVAVGRCLFKPAETRIKRRQKLVGLSGVAMVVALLLSIGIYSYRFSPHAVAESAVNEGLTALQAATPGKMSTLFSQLGVDPKEALKEAKAAKDLKTITKSEFEAEKSKAPGIFASSLGGPGQPQTVAFGVNGPAGAKGGAVAAGRVMVSGTTESTTPTGTSGAKVESGTISISSDGSFSSSNSGPTYTTGSGSGAGSAGTTASVGGNTGEPVTSSFDAKSGIMTTASGAVTATSDTITGTPPAAGATPTVSAMPVSASLTPIKLPEPATYLRYTDKNGRVVVLSLDKDGTPIFKTIFMKSSDTKNLIP